MNDAGLDIVLEGEYKLPDDFKAGENPVILDIGANVGAYSLYAAHEYPNAKIHAYEPVPDNYKLLEQNIEGLNVEIHKTAVSDVTGTTRIYAPRDGFTCGCWSIKEIGEQCDKGKGGVCKVMHAVDLPPADIIKIDTEGCEWEILSNYSHLDKVKAVVLEWHSYADRNRIRDFMMARKFMPVSDTEWSWKSGGRGVQKFVKADFPTLFIGILAGGGKTWGEFETSLAELERYAPLNGINLMVVKESGTGVDRARNRLVATALENPAVSHFLFLDDDIVFQPKDIVNMAASNLDVVGIAYPRKQIDWELVAKAVKDGVPAEELPYYATSHIYNHVVDNEGGHNGQHFEKLGDFVEVEEIGTGCLLIRRRVFEKMLAAYGAEMAYITDYPPRNVVHHTMFACERDPACELERAKRALLEAAHRYWGDALEGKPSRGSLGDFNFAGKHYAEAVAKGKEAIGRYLTEDYAFCRRWRMLGGKVHLYVDGSVGHLGSFKFEGRVKNYLQKQTQTNKEEREEKKTETDG